MNRRTFLSIALVGAAFALASTSMKAGEETPLNSLTAKEKADGWKLLFDGKTLEGWRRWKKQDTTGWSATDGAITLEKPGSGDLMTKEKFGDFELSIDWKFTTGNNSGVLYRVGEEGGQPWQTGIEMQVMTQSPKDKINKVGAGSLYDVFAPTENALKPGKEWNSYKILLKGKHLEHWVNGTKVVETEMGSKEWDDAIAKSKWKGSKLFASQATGHIALQDHGGKISYRNVKVRVPMDAEKK